MERSGCTISRLDLFILEQEYREKIICARTLYAFDIHGTELGWAQAGAGAMGTGIGTRRTRHKYSAC